MTTEIHNKVTKIIVPAMFDAHVHFREGPALPEYVRLTARCCDRAIVMPNTSTPRTSAPLIRNYMEYIQDQVPRGIEFHPLMTLYLTPETRPRDITECVKDLGDSFVGVKIYPRDGTTGSGDGIPCRWFHTKSEIDPMPQQTWDTLRAVADNGKVVLVHGEDNEVRLDKRESCFVWSGFMEKFFEQNPHGKLSMEHISTHSGIERVIGLARKFKCGGSLTLHHMFNSLDDAYRQPHNCCWPAPLWDNDWIKAAARIPENACLWLGSDSAPHAVARKHCVKAACGCFTSPVLAEKLAEMYADDSWVEQTGTGSRHAWRMRRFTSTFAGEFYGVPDTGRQITLVRDAWKVPEEINGCRPWLAGETVQFKLEET